MISWTSFWTQSLSRTASFCNVLLREGSSGVLTMPTSWTGSKLTAVNLRTMKILVWFYCLQKESRIKLPTQSCEGNRTHNSPMQQTQKAQVWFDLIRKQSCVWSEFFLLHALWLTFWLIKASDCKHDGNAVCLLKTNSFADAVLYRSCCKFKWIYTHLF